MKVGEFVNVSKRMVKEYFNRYVVSPNGFQPIKSTDVKTVNFDSDDYIYDIYLVVPNTDYVIYAVRYDRVAKQIYSTILNNVFKKNNISESEETYKIR